MAGVAAGILLARFAGFDAFELCAAGCAFVALGAIARWSAGRTSRSARVLQGPLREPISEAERERGCPPQTWTSAPLAIVCWGLACVCAGALTALLHEPSPPPEIDAGAREVMIVGGCVVEPPAISEGRERFLLEMAPGARAQVTLYTREGEALPTLRYGEKIELDGRIREPRNFGNPGAFDYAGYLARRDIYWTASGAASSVRRQPGGCGSAFQGFAMNLRAAALDRIARLYRGDDYGGAMMQAMLVGQILPATARLDGGLPLHRHVSRAGDFGDARGHSGGVLPLPAAAVLRAGERGAGHHGGGGLAIRGGFRLGRAVRARSGGADAVHDRPLFLSQPPASKPVGGGGAGIPAARPRTAFRSQLSTYVSGGGVSVRVRGSADRGHDRAAGAGSSGTAGHRAGPAFSAAGGAVPGGDAPASPAR